MTVNEDISGSSNVEQSFSKRSHMAPFLGPRFSKGTQVKIIMGYCTRLAGPLLGWGGLGVEARLPGAVLGKS